MRKGILWAALLLAPGVQAATVCGDPVAVGQAFFNASVEDFLAASPALLTPGFAQVLAGERECQREEEGICRFDSDPWLDGQDGEIDTPPVFVAPPSKEAARVTVEARYRVWDDPRVTRVPMVRGDDGCWRVDDLITHGGQSQRALLSAPL
ncbi:hypothetical protein KQ945_17900 [Bacillus subtilis subsp. subtilis]|nr:hypothetical protein [Bacillus subtilis subsp. subtilis]